MLPMLRRARLLRRKIALQQSRLAIPKANASTAEVNPTTKASDAIASTNSDRPAQQVLNPHVWLQGLFGNFLLNHAGGFHLLSQAVGVRSAQLVTEIVSNAEARATDANQPTTVELVDDLSNEICCAADLTDCVRCVHTDADYREAADESMRFYSSLVETLNTTPELYGALKRSLETEKARLDPIGERTAQLLLDDFEQSGVLLQPEERQRFVHLSEEVFDASTLFGLGCDRPVGQLNGPWSGNRDYRIRRTTHSTYYQHNPEQESHLKRLITARHQIAQLIDHSSTFAHRAQRHSVLGTYENVHNFLHGTIKELSSKIDVQLEQIQRIVRDHSTNFDSADDRLGLVDIQFATMISRRQMFEKQIGPPLASHFHLRTILEGFQLLVRELYGIRFNLLMPEPGECWPGNVFKLDVHRMADDSFLGTIFLDLDNRPSKLQGDCHFTVRCSKQLADGDFQTPIVVISLDLIPSKMQEQQQQGNFSDKWHILDEATMLPHQADNFFHEMGHAMHSILGRTRFQHVAGTRCPTDFAEVPSHLMECFLSDTRILQKLFCDQSGRSLSQEQAEAIVQSRHTFGAVHTMEQAIYALFDLELHGERAEDIAQGRMSTTELFGQILGSTFPQIERDENYAYHHRFSHLVTYGAKYHSYLVARASASLIYARLFSADPLSRQSGQRWAEVQSHGGEYPSSVLLSKALGTAHSPGIEQLTQALVHGAPNIVDGI